MKKVAVAGAKGKMGQEVARAVSATDDLDIGAYIDPGYAGGEDAAQMGAPRLHFADIEEALDQNRPDVLVDFTRPDAVEANVRAALNRDIDCVVGTTGLSMHQLEQLERLCQGNTCLFVAPNFAIGAVLLMQFAQTASRYLKKAEIIELHHDQKVDKPSGTALRTAELMEGEVPIHSVRLPGLVAHQEVIFGDVGQTLTLRHDSIDRTSFMPGVLLACREVGKHHGLLIGLENFME